MSEKLNKTIGQLLKSILILTLIVILLISTLLYQSFNREINTEKELAVYGDVFDLDDKPLNELVQYRIVANKINSDFNAKNGRIVFETHCLACHSLSEIIIVGPGLKGLFDRMPNNPTDWIFHFLKNSDSLAQSGDAYTRKLKHNFQNINYKWNQVDSLYTEKEKVNLIGYIGMKQ